jgi:hydrogenase maturation factor
MRRLPVGKLPEAELARLLRRLPRGDPRVLVGPGIGLDCAVVDLGAGRCLVATADPITFATDAIGWYAVQVGANDVATTGALPRWFLATVLLPEGRSDAALAEAVLGQIAEACREVGAELIGGHTEISHGLDRPIVAGTMLGEVAREALVLPGGARPGDRLVLTKRLAVEATALLAREKADALGGRVAAPLLEAARGFLHRPGIGVLRDARAALAGGRVSAMHDPTEGGFATGVHELAEAAGVGIEIDGPAVPVYPETRALCDALGLDPWGAIASGSLLLAVPERDAASVLAALAAAGIEAGAVGRVVEAAGGVRLRDASGLRPLPRFERDEVARTFE